MHQEKFKNHRKFKFNVYQTRAPAFYIYIGLLYLWEQSVTETMHSKPCYYIVTYTNYDALLIFSVFQCMHVQGFELTSIFCILLQSQSVITVPIAFIQKQLDTLIEYLDVDNNGKIEYRLVSFRRSFRFKFFNGNEVMIQIDSFI